LTPSSYAEKGQKSTGRPRIARQRGYLFAVKGPQFCSRNYLFVCKGQWFYTKRPLFVPFKSTPLSYDFLSCGSVTRIKMPVHTFLKTPCQVIKCFVEAIYLTTRYGNRAAVEFNQAIAINRTHPRSNKDMRFAGNLASMRNKGQRKMVLIHSDEEPKSERWYHSSASPIYLCCGKIVPAIHPSAFYIPSVFWDL